MPLGSNGNFLLVGKEMKLTMRVLPLVLTLAGCLALSVSAPAQQAKSSDLGRLQAYSASREVSVVGTVVKFEPAATTPPLGAHLLLQTSSGLVDVHLGNGKLLEAAHLTLNAGDQVRIVGESMAIGDSTYFAGRILQKGPEAVAVRNSRGTLIRYAPLTPAQREALRGAR